MEDVANIMLVTEMTETVTTILKLSSTHFVSNIRHQHRCSPDSLIFILIESSWFADFNPFYLDDYHYALGYVIEVTNRIKLKHWTCPSNVQCLLNWVSTKMILTLIKSVIRRRNTGLQNKKKWILSKSWSLLYYHLVKVSFFWK